MTSFVACSGAVAAVVALAVAPGAVELPLVAQERSLSIESFDATIVVRENGTIDVTEEIQVRFNGSWNGIFRDIPVSYRTPQGFSYKLVLKDVTVTDPRGSELEVQSSRERDYRRLRIRVPGAQDATREVVIRYSVPNGLKFFEDHDELYWNVTGDEWQMPIARASAMVVLPDAVTGLRTASFTGGYGSKQGAASVTEIEDGFYFETTAPLNFREGLTVVVGWDPGVVDRPGALEKAWLFILANWPLILPFLTLVLMHRIWADRGRDPERLSIAPQFAPPDGLTPAEAGTLVDNRPDLRDVTAELVHLAVAGYVRIEEVEGKVIFAKDDFRLVAVKPRESWSELEKHQRAILEGVFGAGSAVVPPTPVMMADLTHEFYRELPAIKDHVFDRLIARRFYDQRPDKVMGVWVGIAIAVTIACLGAVVFLASTSSTLAIPALVIAGALTPIPVWVYGLLMSSRTREGARAQERVLGFEEFLSRVESDRYKRMIDSPEMFERFLPYAMAFGVEKKWAKAFEGIYTEPPDWYRGRWGSGFRPLLFVDSVGSMSSRAATAMGTGPRSSGGSGFSGGGGGGFSGGGFGGGGGGGW